MCISAILEIRYLRNNLSMLRAASLTLFALLIHFSSRAQTAVPVLAPGATTTLPPKFGSREVRIHDPSTIIREGSTYWTFYTGRGTPSYRSKDLITWTNGPRVFNEAPAWITNAVPNNRGGLDFWAPDLIKAGERYLLYYSVSTFGRNTSAIGLASNKTLNPGSPDFNWSDEGPVIQSTATNNFNAIDPAVTFDRAGRLWMSFGSFWSGIKLVELDPKTGQRLAGDSAIHSLAKYESIEAPYICYHDNFYYLFVNWGRCCRGTNSTYNIRVGRSQKITGPYLDKEKKDMLEGGGALLLDSDGEFIGPGHAGILHEGTKDWLSFHFYDATRRGMSTFAIRPLAWEKDGWPTIKDAQ
jgi:arabinan endo-1,5-alpha-L-arabinosidase